MARRNLARTSTPISASTAATATAVPAYCHSRTGNGAVSCIASVPGLMEMPKMRRPASLVSIARHPSAGSAASCPSALSHITSPRQHNSPPANAAGKRIASNHGMARCQR